MIFESSANHPSFSPLLLFSATMSFVCSGCGSCIKHFKSYTRHMKTCPRALEVAASSQPPIPEISSPTPQFIAPASQAASQSRTIPQPKKRGRPEKPLSQQSPRTDQNKKARFAKDIKAVEELHGLFLSLSLSPSLSPSRVFFVLSSLFDQGV